MMEVHFNNKKITIDPQHSLALLLTQLGYQQAHYAVAVNKNFIPRSRHEHTYLHAGDCVDIITPMQGG